MNSKLKIALIAVVGAAFGAAGMQALYAQVTPKAYIVTELEAIDVEAQKVYSPLAQVAQKAAGGRNFRTGGKIVAFAGEAPKRVAITEWDSLDAALAFRNGKAWKDLVPQRDKAFKITRSYAVEAVP